MKQTADSQGRITTVFEADIKSKPIDRSTSVNLGFYKNNVETVFPTDKLNSLAKTTTFSSQLEEKPRIRSESVDIQKDKAKIEYRHSTNNIVSNKIPHNKQFPPTTFGYQDRSQTSNSALPSLKMNTDVGDIKEKRILLGMPPKHGFRRDPNSQIFIHRDKIKGEVARGEKDLRQMVGMKKSLSATDEFNEHQRQQLSSLKLEAEMCGQNLREAVNKADYLKKRLEQLYQSRANAASLAIAQQRKINGGSGIKENSTFRSSSVIPNINTTTSLPNKNSYSCSATFRPQASIEPFNVNSRLVENPTKNLVKPPPSYNYHSGGIINHIDYRLKRASLNKDQQGTDKKILCKNYDSFASDASSSSGIEDNTRTTAASTYKTDQLLIRSDTLKAAKRRSLVQAEQGPGDSESDNIRRLLVEEQRKGRTHISFAESVLSKDIKKTIEPCRSLSQESGHVSDTIAETAKQKEIGESSDEAFVEEYNSMDKESNDDDLVTKKMNLHHGVTIASSESSSCASDDSLANLKSVDIYDSEPSISPLSVEEHEEESTENFEYEIKGILKKSGERKEKGRIRFDPLVLFFDAALEGQLETVMENALLVKSVSQPNEEGITALHNAICAGYLEVVKYLIGMKADVNAQDSDGWTPLHCAASCNSLPISKILIENGACLYAKTISDFETPFNKLETEEEQYDDCKIYFEIVGKCMGLVNEKRVFAFHDYDAMEEDELTFKKGDSLTVLSKSVGEECWWLCENKATNQKGLVPINFLTLYPTVEMRESHDFKEFCVPNSKESFDKLCSISSPYQRPKISPPPVPN